MATIPSKPATIDETNPTSITFGQNAGQHRFSLASLKAWVNWIIAVIGASAAPGATDLTTQIGAKVNTSDLSSVAVASKPVAYNAASDFEIRALLPRTDKAVPTPVVNEIALYSKSDERIYRKGYNDTTEYGLAEDFKTGRQIPSVYLNGADAYISVANNANINFGTGTFSIITEQLFESGSTLRYKEYKYTVGNIGYQIAHLADNKVRCNVGDGTNILTVISTAAITDGNFHKIGFIVGVNSASTKLIIDGIEDVTAVKSGTFPALTTTNTTPLYTGSVSGGYHKNEVRNTQLYNYALTVENCRKYMYESLPYSEIGASNVDGLAGNGLFATDTTAYFSKANGTLTWNSGTQDETFVASGPANDSYISKGGVYTVGKRYRITFKAKSTNSTAIPSPAASNIVASSIAPPLTTTYQNYTFETLQNITLLVIAPFASLGSASANGLDCTIDDLVITQIGNVFDLNEKTVNQIKWNDSLNRMYADLINCETINLPTNYQATLPYNGITGNSTVVIPKGYMIEAIYVKNTTANAITGGIKLGTTSGGTEVISALAIGANYNDAIDNSSVILKKFFSDTANTTLYLQAVTAWNGASLNWMIVCRRIL